MILACLKWVALRPEIDPLTGAPSPDDRFSGASAADWSALEWALRLADPDPVVAVSVGPEGADRVLRDALAAGACDVVRIDLEDQDVPSRAVARELAAVARDVGPVSLVCAGDYSLDRGSGSVPAFLAHELGWPQALGLIRAVPEGDALVVERRLDQGRRERLAIGGPAVLSFEAGPELRRASLSATITAAEAAISVRSAVAAPAEQLTTIETGPYRPRANVKPAPTGGTADRIIALSGSAVGEPTARIHEVPAEVAAALAHAQLIEWGYLEPPSQ